MITIEEKLNIFSKLVLESERKKAREKIEKIQKKNDEAIKTHLDKSKEKAKKQIQKRIHEANNRKKEIIARAKMEANSNILTKKSEFLGRLYNSIENRANKFTEASEYEIFFLNSLSKILLEVKVGENNSIYIINSDLDRYRNKVIEKIDSLEQQGIKVSIEKLDDSAIGGLMLINHDKGIRIDLTIKTILEKNYDLMGRMVYLSLEEVGD